MGTNKGDNTNNADKEEIISKIRFINGYMVVIYLGREFGAESSELSIRYEQNPTSLPLRATYIF